MNEPESLFVGMADDYSVDPEGVTWAIPALPQPGSVQRSQGSSSAAPRRAPGAPTQAQGAPGRPSARRREVPRSRATANEFGKPAGNWLG